MQSGGSRGGKGIKRIVESRYRESARRISQSLPSEFITLYDLTRGRLSIRLNSGEEHFFDEREAREIMSLAPPYFWKLARIPILLRYEKTASGRARYVVQGDSWQKRLIEIMLRGEYTHGGVGELSVSEFQKLVSRFRTMLFVTLRP